MKNHLKQSRFQARRWYSSALIVPLGPDDVHLIDCRLKNLASLHQTVSSNFNPSIHAVFVTVKVLILSLFDLLGTEETED